MKIKFGTDGWRAIIADDYTYENVRRVAEGTAAYMHHQGMKKVVIGYDTRFGGKDFSLLVAGVLASSEIKVILSNRGFSSTPMVSLAVREFRADLGIVITASHNPPAYNGYKLKSKTGGSSIPAEVAAVEEKIPDKSSIPVMSLEEMEERKWVEYHDLEQLYIDHIKSSFDLEAIRQTGLKIAYDAMYGAGQNVIRRLFPSAHLLRCTHNPSFGGNAPEPIARNLSELSTFLKNNRGQYALGMATDGDADRIGLYDENGNFVDSHHILLLLVEYFHQVKKAKGKVIITFSVTDQVRRLAKLYGIDVDITKIGFKYIVERMMTTDIVVAGEESGGIAVAGHIPERDGIWAGLLILEYIAKSGKSLTTLIQDLYDKVGAFACDRIDLHLTEKEKNDILEYLPVHPFTNVGDQKVSKIEDLDGYKYILENGDWVMIRPSGTEPVLRIYGQSETKEKVKQLLEEMRVTLTTIK